MSSESNGRLDLGCLIGNIAATVVTKNGVVYQGTIIDWDCSRSVNSTDSSSSTSNATDSARSCSRGDISFIRIELTCIPGNICCPIVAIGTSRVTPILGFDGSTDPLFSADTTVFINWDDVSSIGSQRPCLTEA